MGRVYTHSGIVTIYMGSDHRYIDIPPAAGTIVPEGGHRGRLGGRLPRQPRRILGRGAVFFVQRAWLYSIWRKRYIMCSRRGKQGAVLSLCENEGYRNPWIKYSIYLSSPLLPREEGCGMMILISRRPVILHPFNMLPRKRHQGWLFLLFVVLAIMIVSYEDFLRFRASTQGPDVCEKPNEKKIKWHYNKYGYSLTNSS